jgi:uncharacterized membrane protein
MLQFRQITLNLVYFLNVLLLFLLVFEDKVQLPVFLQVTGRMHPLVMHFPLALLFVGLFLEWLTTRKDFQHPAAREITSYIFFLFALGASFSALFGFFLYEEGSYQGDEMTRHKWMGTAVSLMAVLILWLKERGGAVYYTTLALSAVCLVAAGHFGAEITHGKGFLTEPIRKHWLAKPRRIDHPDSAIVFRDVIQPILNEKCVNCHNSNKAKNDLILTDYEHMVKGGKNEQAIVPGKAEESLIYKYALLPMQDSLHMPPSGKLQLDAEEIELIGWWINTGAHASEKYANMTKPDSIHPVMLSKFQPRSGLDLLDIPFADQEEIKRLNNPYRTVQQISATKPYIAVFLGSKKDFSDKDLADLKGIRDNVVSIDLGNSLVTDKDIKHLTDFPHLQKLHLQNVEIGDEGVQQLRSLRYLNILNISGTKVSTKTLEEVTDWKNLKKLYLYNTQVPAELVRTFKKNHPGLEVYDTHFDLSDSVYSAQLGLPVCKIDSPVFYERTSAEVKLSRGKVKYYYTLDGTEPTREARLYTAPLEVSRSSVLKIMATMDGWIDSKVAVFPLLKIGAKPVRIIVEGKPNAKYDPKLDSILIDGKSGGVSRTAKEYVGITKPNVRLLIELDKPKELSQVAVSFLEDIEKGAFPPEYIEVWAGEEKNSLQKIAMVKAALPSEKRSPFKDLLVLNFEKVRARYVRVNIKISRRLPSWPSLQKDVQPSGFVDEVALD